MPVTLTARDRARLKAAAHPLAPVVFIGHGGLTDRVVAEVDRALTAHGLIKVRIDAADREARAALATDVGSRTDAAEVQRVGKVLTLYRPKADEDE